MVGCFSKDADTHNLINTTVISEYHCSQPLAVFMYLQLELGNVVRGAIASRLMHNLRLGVRSIHPTYSDMSSDINKTRSV